MAHYPGEQETYGHLIGKTIQDAAEILQGQGMTLRVIKSDGRWCGITDDMKADRLGVIVERDVITEIDRIG